jgi:hypothetical protein
MADEKFCQGCHQKHRCQDVYEHLSHVRGTGVVLKVILAFLLPIVVFIGSLAAFEEILAKVIQSKELKTAISMVLALAVSGSFVFITNVIKRGIVKNKQSQHYHI